MEKTTVLMGRIEMNMELSPEGAIYTFGYFPVDSLVGTEFEDMLAAATGDLMTRVREWEKNYPTGKEMKIAAMMAHGFIQDPSDEDERLNMPGAGPDEDA